MIPHRHFFRYLLLACLPLIATPVILWFGSWELRDEFDPFVNAERRVIVLWSGGPEIVLSTSKDPSWVDTVPKSDNPVWLTSVSYQRSGLYGVSRGTFCGYLLSYAGLHIYYLDTLMNADGITDPYDRASIFELMRGIALADGYYHIEYHGAIADDRLDPYIHTVFNKDTPRAVLVRRNGDRVTLWD